MFRDLSGAVGVLHLHCPHRGTSLEYGGVEQHGHSLLLSRPRFRRRRDDPRDAGERPTPSVS